MEKQRSVIYAAIQSAEDLYDKYPEFENEYIRGAINHHIMQLEDLQEIFESQIKHAYIRGAIDARYDNDDSERYYTRTFETEVI